MLSPKDMFRRLVHIHMADNPFKGDWPIDRFSNDYRVKKLKAVNSVLTRAAKGREARLDVLSNLLGRDVDSSNEMTLAEVRAFIDCAYNRSEDGLSIDKEFLACLKSMVKEPTRDAA